ncbi:hypothetical protein CBF23_009485 [Marinomonas agarivorans]|nr:hypothetical protein CBF23_009485 [Marinomonas agarivorans]
MANLSNSLAKLPRIYASDHFQYAVSAKELYQFLLPLPPSPTLKQAPMPYGRWIDHRVMYYGFEAGYDFVLLEEKASLKESRRSPDFSLSLNMAKELARLERTAQGREARYHFINFEQELTKQDLRKTYGDKLDKKVKQLNQLAESIRVGENVMVIPTIDVINLIKAIRQYQTIADLYLKPEHDINPYWVNDVIEQLKQKSGKLLLDEEENR